jgi:hypothetical protein
MDVDEPFYIRRIAKRVLDRGSSGLMLCQDGIQIVLANRNKPELMRDCQTIIQAYPDDFKNRT